MKQLQFLIKPAAGYCNMRCQYCFYRDEQQNRVNPDDCIMSFTTAETLIQRCFAEIEQGGYISFAFQGGEPTLAGLDFFRFFTQTVQKYNQKRVTVQYAIQTNGLAVTEEWAEFFSKEHFLVGISLDGTPDVHDALRPDTQGNGTWNKTTQTIELLHRYGVECNLLCVVTKRLAKKAGRVYKSMKATGVRYLQFIPCLDPLDTPQGQQPYSLTPELYAQFCAPCLMPGIGTGKPAPMSASVCLRIIFICLWAARLGLAPQQAPAARTWSWRVAAPSTRATFSAWTLTNSEPCKTTPCNRCLPAKKCGRLSRTAGRYPQSASNASGSTCAVAAANVTATLPTKYGAVIIAKRCKGFLPTQNRACTKWFALFKCTAEKETNIYWTRKINAGSCFSLPLS